MIVVLLLSFVLSVSAQVTIGLESDPVTGAILEIKSQESNVVSTSSVTDNATKLKHGGLMIYNVETIIEGFKQDVYVWDGSKWKLLGKDSGNAGASTPSFIYLPSFNLPVITALTTFDIYNDVYVKNFNKQSVGLSWNSLQYLTSANSITEKTLIGGTWEAAGSWNNSIELENVLLPVAIKLALTTFEGCFVLSDPEVASS